jgi:hypothetical protein
LFFHDRNSHIILITRRNDLSDQLNNVPSQLPSFIAQDILAAQANIQNAVQQLAQLQVAGIRATFDSLPLDQRDKYCQSLQNSGYTASQITALTDKSYATVNRHLNGKNT